MLADMLSFDCRLVARVRWPLLVLGVIRPRYLSGFPHPYSAFPRYSDRALFSQKVLGLMQ